MTRLSGSRTVDGPLNRLFLWIVGARHGLRGSGQVVGARHGLPQRPGGAVADVVREQAVRERGEDVAAAHRVVARSLLGRRRVGLSRRVVRESTWATTTVWRHRSTDSFHRT
jgi:hypothetical protein